MLDAGLAEVVAKLESEGFALRRTPRVPGIQMADGGIHLPWHKIFARGFSPLRGLPANCERISFRGRLPTWVVRMRSRPVIFWLPEAAPTYENRADPRTVHRQQYVHKNTIRNRHISSNYCVFIEDFPANHLHESLCTHSCYRPR